MVIGRGAWLDGSRLRLQAANRRGALSTAEQYGTTAAA
jgi:predicted RNA-binding protein YlxR (DUF448 family)